MNIEISVGRVPVPEDERARAKALLEAHPRFEEVMQFVNAVEVGDWVKEEYTMNDNYSSSLQKAILSEAVAQWNKRHSEKAQ